MWYGKHDAKSLGAGVLIYQLLEVAVMSQKN
jgi:hypothetical protein